MNPKFTSKRPTTAGHYWFRDGLHKNHITIVRVFPEYGEGPDQWRQSYLGASETRGMLSIIGQWAKLPNAPDEMTEYEQWVEQGNNAREMSNQDVFNEGLAWARDGLPPEEEPEG